MPLVIFWEFFKNRDSDLAEEELDISIKFPGDDWSIGHTLMSKGVYRPSQKEEAVGCIHQLTFVFPGKRFSQNANSLLNDMRILKYQSSN